MPSSLIVSVGFEHNIRSPRFSAVQPLPMPIAMSQIRFNVSSVVIAIQATPTATNNARTAKRRRRPNHFDESLYVRIPLFLVSIFHYVEQVYAVPNGCLSCRFHFSKGSTIRFELIF